MTLRIPLGKIIFLSFQKKNSCVIRFMIIPSIFFVRMHKRHDRVGMPPSADKALFGCMRMHMAVLSTSQDTEHQKIALNYHKTYDTGLFRIVWHNVLAYDTKYLGLKFSANLRCRFLAIVPQNDVKVPVLSYSRRNDTDPKPSMAKLHASLCSASARRIVGAGS